MTAAASKFSVPSKNFLWYESLFWLYSHWMALHEFNGCDPLILIVAPEAKSVGPANDLTGTCVLLAFVGRYTESIISLGFMETVAFRTVVVVGTGGMDNGR